jgi:Domain of unknown function DUF302
MRWPAMSLLVAVPVLAALPAGADEVRTYTTHAALADVLTDLEQAVIGRGLTVDVRGDMAAMLARTGAAVGDTSAVYRGARFIGFCSAKLSRAMVEADPANVAFCPYVIFAYEAVQKPDEVTVGYRRPQSTGGSEATVAALASIDALIDGVIREALK